MKKQTRREEDFDQYFDFEDSYDEPDEPDENPGISKSKDARKSRHDMKRKFKNKRFENDEY